MLSYPFQIMTKPSLNKPKGLSQNRNLISLYLVKETRLELELKDSSRQKRNPTIQQTWLYITNHII